jgi:Sec-independent protein secretion pathway component TatC
MISTLPLFALYEVGIVVASRVEKRRNEKHEAIMND